MLRQMLICIVVLTVVSACAQPPALVIRPTNTPTPTQVKTSEKLGTGNSDGVSGREPGPAPHAFVPGAGGKNPGLSSFEKNKDPYLIAEIMRRAREEVKNRK